MPENSKQWAGRSIHWSALVSSQNDSFDAFDVLALLASVRSHSIATSAAPPMTPFSQMTRRGNETKSLEAHDGFPRFFREKIECSVTNDMQ